MKPLNNTLLLQFRFFTLRCATSIVLVSTRILTKHLHELHLDSHTFPAQYNKATYPLARSHPVSISHQPEHENFARRPRKYANFYFFKK